jgi:hypothetical protein
MISPTLLILALSQLARRQPERTPAFLNGGDRQSGRRDHRLMTLIAGRMRAPGVKLATTSMKC